ncbi:hypothetical protein FDP41_000538 [Naegleria fowleri]|uniref:Uncharacterized protein n=1 Tax=Naegleria fowleri TaxID=5763 RepID=A0A6A5CH67_NAEFO|nr:uncharacterized protein FDP41_000538 [Naegleria fowleri]KAF0984639.1 hypothetical protein FDP41_000538 [Naegleria fowleri]CAG4718472.1 unnamed protein product [Naegleria fowleri]
MIPSKLASHHDSSIRDEIHFQKLFSPELLALLQPKNSVENINKDHISVHDVSDDDERSQNATQMIPNIPQLGLYYEMREKISTSSSIPNDYLQYNFIRLAPQLLSENERNNTVSLVFENQFIEISKLPSLDNTPAPMSETVVETIKEKVKQDFASSNTITYFEPSLITFDEFDESADWIETEK